MCISRRALKGRKYLFRDIHNFSFSAKIQDDIFPLGTEYCCTTPWVKNSLEIALSVTSGGTIRRELDFQTRVRVLASTSIPIGNVGDRKKTTKPQRRFEWTIIEILATMKE